MFGDSGLGSGFKEWGQALQARADCDVLKVPGNHWFMLKSPEQTNAAVIEWLDFELGGKLVHARL